MTKEGIHNRADEEQTHDEISTEINEFVLVGSKGKTATTTPHAYARVLNVESMRPKNEEDEESMLQLALKQSRKLNSSYLNAARTSSSDEADEDSKNEFDEPSKDVLDDTSDASSTSHDETKHLEPSPKNSRKPGRGGNGKKPPPVIYSREDDMQFLDEQIAKNERDQSMKEAELKLQKALANDSTPPVFNRDSSAAISDVEKTAREGGYHSSVRAVLERCGITVDMGEAPLSGNANLSLSGDTELHDSMPVREAPATNPSQDNDSQKDDLSEPQEDETMDGATVSPESASQSKGDVQDPMAASSDDGASSDNENVASNDVQSNWKPDDIIADVFKFVKGDPDGNMADFVDWVLESFEELQVTSHDRLGKIYLVWLLMKLGIPKDWILMEVAGSGDGADVRVINPLDGEEFIRFEVKVAEMTTTSRGKLYFGHRNVKGSGAHVVVCLDLFQDPRWMVENNNKIYGLLKKYYGDAGINYDEANWSVPSFDVCDMANRSRMKLHIFGKKDYDRVLPNGDFPVHPFHDNPDIRSRHDDLKADVDNNEAIKNLLIRAYPILKDIFDYFVSNKDNLKPPPESSSPVKRQNRRNGLMNSYVFGVPLILFCPDKAGKFWLVKVLIDAGVNPSCISMEKQPHGLLADVWVTNANGRKIKLEAKAASAKLDYDQTGGATYLHTYNGLERNTNLGFFLYFVQPTSWSNEETQILKDLSSKFGVHAGADWAAPIVDGNNPLHLPRMGVAILSRERVKKFATKNGRDLKLRTFPSAASTKQVEMEPFRTTLDNPLALKALLAKADDGLKEIIDPDGSLCSKYDALVGEREPVAFPPGDPNPPDDLKLRELFDKAMAMANTFEDKPITKMVSTIDTSIKAWVAITGQVGLYVEVNYRGQVFKLDRVYSKQPAFYGRELVRHFRSGRKMSWKQAQHRANKLVQEAFPNSDMNYYKIEEGYSVKCGLSYGDITSDVTEAVAHAKVQAAQVAEKRAAKAKNKSTNSKKKLNFSDNDDDSDSDVVDFDSDRDEDSDLEYVAPTARSKSTRARKRVDYRNCDDGDSGGSDF